MEHCNGLSFLSILISRRTYTQQPAAAWYAMDLKFDKLKIWGLRSSYLPDLAVDSWRRMSFVIQRGSTKSISIRTRVLDLTPIQREWLLG